MRIEKQSAAVVFDKLDVCSVAHDLSLNRRRRTGSQNTANEMDSRPGSMIDLIGNRSVHDYNIGYSAPEVKLNRLILIFYFLIIVLTAVERRCSCGYMVILVDSSGRGVQTRDLRRSRRESVRFVSEKDREKRIRELMRKYRGVQSDGNTL